MARTMIAQDLVGRRARGSGGKREAGGEEGGGGEAHVPTLRKEGPGCSTPGRGMGDRGPEAAAQRGTGFNLGATA